MVNQLLAFLQPRKLLIHETIYKGDRYHVFYWKMGGFYSAEVNGKQIATSEDEDQIFDYVERVMV